MGRREEISMLVLKCCVCGVYSAPKFLWVSRMYGSARKAAHIKCCPEALGACLSGAPPMSDMIWANWYLLKPTRATFFGDGRLSTIVDKQKEIRGARVCEETTALAISRLAACRD